MMHLTFADKDLILGSDAAELVVEYAAVLARAHSADTVKLSAYGSDGDKVEATLLLDEGAPLMIETANSDLPEPDNTAVVHYMRQEIERISTPLQAMPMSSTDDVTIADFESHFDTDHGSSTAP